jgi:hypothetical protein
MTSIERQMVRAGQWASFPKGLSCDAWQAAQEQAHVRPGTRVCALSAGGRLHRPLQAASERLKAPAVQLHLSFRTRGAWDRALNHAQAARHPPFSSWPAPLPRLRQAVP